MLIERLLLSCVNTRVSLVGFDLKREAPFWYCPSTVLHACGAVYDQQALWVASDATLCRIGKESLSFVSLPGPHANYVHSVKQASDGLLVLCDTGNSRLLFFDGSVLPLSLSPLEEWERAGCRLPFDAIHVNDCLPWRDGFLVSAFSHEPFTAWKETGVPWQKAGLGCIYYLTREGKRTLARIVACGINCPHSLVLHEGDIYCCSSASGDFLQFHPDEENRLHLVKTVHVTSTHFLRGALRIDGGWILGGSSRRHAEDGGGMLLYKLADDGGCRTMIAGGTGEIYDILPWNPVLEPFCDTLEKAPDKFEDDGANPPRCHLPSEYR
ncbi:MAG: hypothetical protein K5657_01210 [Desulfovibrio sp.]|nr:hypothetical protein [Desulfovibrio sp.]